MARTLSHLDASGNARMVGVGHKPDVSRIAEARAWIQLAPATLRLLKKNALPKGDVLTVAQIAGIQAAKQTSALIPLCHPLPLHHIDLHFTVAPLQAGEKRDIAFDLRLTLGGTERFAFVPLADENHVRLQSSWQHPNFDGQYSPRSPSIGATGFDASWDISALASGVQAQYLSGASGDAGTAGVPDAVVAQEGRAPGTLESLSVTLSEPVNLYSQADRASKYGVLFIALTFVGFFMFELIKRLAIHPIQYALVGLALAIFFLLLLSLSEHIPFVWAYVSASAACIGLLGIYLSAVLRSAMRAFGFAGMLTLLYGALYGLLVSEDNALVLGSLMLFAILAAIMIVTRRIDWYALSASGPPPIPERTAVSEA